ncbi:MAG: phosphoglycolate phosphatase [Acetobacter sp.]
MTARRLAVFDMDGTLLDSLPDLAESCREMLVSYGLPPVSDAEVRGMIGQGVQVLVTRVLALVAHKLAGQPGAPVAPLPESTEAAERFMACYTPRAARLSRLFPGTEEALHILRAQGWGLAVCTNKPERAARAILDALGVAALFSAVGGGDSFTARKPDPVHLLGTIAQAGGQAARSVMVGDMPPDWLAAQGAGCSFVFAAWGYGGATPAQDLSCPVALAQSMAEVPAMLDALLPGAVPG